MPRRLLPDAGWQEEVTLRPRIGRRPSTASAPFRVQLLKRLARSGKLVGRKLRVNSGDRLRVINPRGPKSPLSRRAIIKARYVRTSPRSAKAAALHLAYIERDGVERDGSPGRLYGPNGPLERSDMLEPRPGEPHQFRLILSPEDGARLDLTQYTRDFMALVQHDLEQRVEWAAVNHYDTGNPHVHLVIRGLDAEGREVRFSRGYLAHGLRERAQELATEALGLRMEHDLARQRRREVTQERLTTLDRQLGKVADEEGRVRMRDIAELRSPYQPELVGRVHFLEQLQLATKTAAGHWRLKDEWEHSLRVLGERGDIIKQLSRATGGVCRETFRVLERTAEAAKKPPLLGVVRAKGLLNEIDDRQYAVVSTPDGTAHHITLSPRQAEKLREGAAVELRLRPATHVSPIDGQLASAVDRLGTALTPQDLGNLPRPSGADPCVLEHRLDKLTRDGIVQKGKGGWTLPQDLLGVLRTKDRESPVYALVVDAAPLRPRAQVQHPGPVWLDRLRAQPLAPYGIGPELGELLRQRDAVLRQLGIDPEAPDRLRQLAELERRSVHQRESAARGLSTAQGAHVRGRLELLPPEASGGQYAVITGREGIAVVRAFSEHRKLHGREVDFDLTRPPKDRVRARDRGLER